MDVHAEDGNGGVEKEGGGEKVMKKGPWTVAEDAMLMEYVKKHGEGNWNAVVRNSGLQRCGKSCRLRWANHLRPNLKKGAFSMDEEKAIIQLHAKYGNKWARMASQLPGRTDNEIKNYWNTRLKRRQRAGLPVYPQEIQREVVEFQLQQHQQKHKQKQHHRQRQDQQQQQQQNPHSSSVTFSSFFPSSPTGHLVQNLAYNPHFALIDPNKISQVQTHPNPSLFRYLNGQPNFFASTYNSDGLSLPLSSVSPVSCNASLSLYPSSFPSQMFNQSFTSLLMPTNNNHEYNAIHNQFELPSFQTRDQISNVTPASSATSGGEAYANCPKTPPNTGENDYVVEPFFHEKCSGGLLDDMLKESQTICSNVKVKGEKGKDLMDDFMGEASGSDLGDLNGDSSSAHSSIGKKSMQEPMVEMNLFEDDELSSILKTFGSTSNNGISSSIEGDNVVQEASPSPSTNAMDDHNELTLGFCCWNNMPTIS